MRDDRAATMEDPSAIGEQRFLTLGMDALGRVMVVCHTQRDERKHHFRSQSQS